MMFPCTVVTWCHVKFILTWILMVSVNAYLYSCPCDMLSVWMWSLFDGVHRFYCCLVSHIFIISQCHACAFFHILVLHIIISSTSFSSGELFSCILHVFIPIKLLLLLEEKTLRQHTWTVGESLWPTHCPVFSWSTFSIESQKQMF